MGKKHLLKGLIFDGIIKSQKVRFPVIPAKAGIQLFQILKNSLDSGFHRSDDFLREHQKFFATEHSEATEKIS
jgi:hypothetical protein